MPVSDNDRDRIRAALNSQSSRRRDEVIQQAASFTGWLNGIGKSLMNSWPADVVRNAGGATAGAAAGHLASRNLSSEQKMLATAIGAALGSAVQDVAKRIADEGRGRPSESKARQMLEERLRRDERVITALQRAQNPRKR